jgi:hypothetical protein
VVDLPEVRVNHTRELSLLMPPYLYFNARDFYHWARRKRVICPECNMLRRALYILPSLVVTCAACLPAHGIDPRHPDRPVSLQEIARTRRRIQELSPLAPPITDPPLPEGFTLPGPGRPRKVQDPDASAPPPKATRPRAPRKPKPPPAS